MKSVQLSSSVDAFIWGDAALRKLLAHENAEVRRWALLRFGLRLDDPERLVLATECLHDDDEEVVSLALRMMKTCDFKLVDSELAVTAVGEFLGRATTDHQRIQADLILASLGDKGAATRLLSLVATESLPVLDFWVQADRDNVSDAVQAQFPDGVLPADLFLLHACIGTSAQQLVPAILDAIDRLDFDEERDALLHELLAQAGGSLNDLSLDWLSSTHGKTQACVIQASPLIDAGIEPLFATLLEITEKSDYRRAVAQCRAIFDFIEKRAPHEVDIPEWRFSRAIVEALPNKLSDEDLSPLYCRLVFNLARAALRVVSVENALQSSENATDFLQAWAFAAGITRRRVESRFLQWWESLNNSEGEAFSNAIKDTTKWLDDFTISTSALPEILDAHLLATQLTDFSVVDRTIALYIARKSSDETDEVNNELVALVQEALREDPETLRVQADALICHDDYLLRTTALAVLKLRNETWASAALRQHVQEKSCYANTFQFWEAVGELGDTSMLDDVVEAWHPGEVLIARCARFLATLADKIDALPAHLLEDADKPDAMESMVESVEQGLHAGDELAESLADSEPMPIPLVCTECGDTHVYEMMRCYVNPGEGMTSSEAILEKLTADRVITCNSCDAVDAYTFSADATVDLIPHLVRVLSDPEDETNRIALVRMELSDGTVVERPSHGIERLRALAQANPEDPEVWRQLGTFCHLVHENPQAEEALRKAIEINPDDIESIYTLADLLWNNSDSNDDVHFMFDALVKLPEADLSSEEREFLAHQLVEMLHVFVDDTDVPVMMIAGWFNASHGANSEMTISDMNLRDVKRWDRLAALFAANSFSSVGFSSVQPSESDGLLEGLINQQYYIPAASRKLPQRRQETFVHSDEKVGRNDPCPCGSGKKHKRCCL